MKRPVPYQLFFPWGLLSALVAVGIWFVQNLFWFESPAILIHSKLIAGGFLWSFIVGFLMTAIPRMTGTAIPNNFEYILAAALVIAQTFLSWQVDPRLFYANQIAVIVFLLAFGVRRIFKTTKPIPIFISHVGTAMALGVLGSYFHFRGNSYMGIHLYHVGAILVLVLGIGARFFSLLSGLPSVFEDTKLKGPRLAFHFSGLFVGVLLFLAGRGLPLSYLGLSALSLFYLFKIWQVQRPANRPSALKHGARIAAAVIPLSFFLAWLQPSMFLTWFHLLFIACFALLTFSVAARVTLAHGSYPVELETKSRALWCMFISLVLASVFRIVYGMSGVGAKMSFLHLAATFWILAVGSWCWAFLPRIFKLGPLATVNDPV